MVVVVALWESFATQFTHSQFGVLSFLELGVMHPFVVHLEGTLADKAFVTLGAGELAGVRFLVATQLALVSKGPVTDVALKLFLLMNLLHVHCQQVLLEERFLTLFTVKPGQPRVVCLQVSFDPVDRGFDCISANSACNFSLSCWVHLQDTKLWPHYRDGQY